MMYTKKTAFLVLGILLGIVIRRFTLSVRSVRGFCRRILPALTALREYSAILTNCMLKTEVHDQALIEGKIKLQKALLERYSSYPEWIYTAGFNPGLRSGFRSFLIHLECVVELHFAIASTVIFHETLKVTSADQQIAMSPVEEQHFKQSIQRLAEPLSGVMLQNEELIDVLILFCETHATTELSAEDYVSDIKQLDAALDNIVPKELELLDLSPSSIRIVSLVRDIKEVRQVLLQLLASLPN